MVDLYATSALIALNLCELKFALEMGMQATCIAPALQNVRMHTTKAGYDMWCDALQALP